MTLRRMQLGWLGLAFCLVASPVVAQSARPDTSKVSRSANDPFITGVYHPADYAKERSGPSAGRGDATGVYYPESPTPPPGSDSASAAVQPKDSARAKLVPSAPPIPEAVMTACGKAPAGAEAPGLLAVLFRPDASDADRAAIAKQAGATLAGHSPFGDDYVSFPASAGPNSAVADRLARLPRVSQITPVSCPGPARIAAARAAHGTPCPPVPDTAAVAGRQRSKTGSTR